MVFSLELKSNRGKLIAWFIVVSILTGLLTAFLPLLQDENILSLANSFRDGFSPNMQSTLGFPKDLKFDEFTDFIPFIFQYLGVLFAILAIQLGAKSLTKEQSAGTIEYLYANPLTRTEIFTGKFSANIFGYGLTLLGVLLVGFIAAYAFGVHDMRNLALVMLQIFICLLLLGFEFLAIGYFYSSISSRSSHAEGGAFLIFLVILAIWAAMNLAGGSLHSVAKLFPFWSLNPLNMVSGSGFQWTGIIVNVVIGIIFWIIGCVIYKSKELRF
ncbi:MAG: ABC transporter permease subunit [Peptoniphilus sp.]|nr:ABC transporter permease subunit [Peptoniphilus sp.]MDD7362906.1 ABC transporter permease subunit [Bacillota bacterium]MDY6044146.1 ABC transporter permease subunit [Peptoniphilus sp.]